MCWLSYYYIIIHAEIYLFAIVICRNCTSTYYIIKYVFWLFYLKYLVFYTCYICILPSFVNILAKLVGFTFYFMLDVQSVWSVCLPLLEVVALLHCRFTLYFVLNAFIIVGITRQTFISNHISSIPFHLFVPSLFYSCHVTWKCWGYP